MTTDTLAKLAADERTELLDWVSACQSAHLIDSTPGHRFGGLPSSLDDNRELLVVHVESILAERVRALTAQALPAAGRCDECGKDQAEGWALYCVDCLEKTGLLAKEALPNAQHVSSTAADLTASNDTAARAITGAATTGASSEPFGYFKAEPFGWTDCVETDDGAIALYERPNAGGQLEQVAKLHGTRKVLWDLLGECLPLLKVDAEFSTDYEGKEAIELLIEQIEAARSHVQSDELPGKIEL